MKYEVDVWYPHGSTQETNDFKNYISDLPKNLSTKTEVEQALQDIWNQNAEYWFNFDDLEITTTIRISDEEYEQYLLSNNNLFDVWAAAVRESRKKK